MKTTAFLLFLHLCALVTASPRTRQGLAWPSLPDNDSFYLPPKDFESAAPGAILRQRRVDAAILSVLPRQDIETHQLLYRTVAINGSAIATVVTIFRPRNAQTDRFISFQTAYDSSALKCRPSFAYQLGAVPSNLVPSVEYLIIELYLAAGYIVSSADYEGPDDAFAAGELEGVSTLDSMRAVINFRNNLRLSVDNPMVVGVGYSGGAIATAWAASLHAAYAGDLRIKGWTSGGTPVDTRATLLHLDNTAFSGLQTGALAGLAKPSAYGDVLGPLLDKFLTPAGQTAVNYARTECAATNLLKFLGRSILEKDFQALGSGLLNNSIVSDAIRRTSLISLPSGSPVAPMLLYHAIHDEIIPFQPAAEINNRWCGGNANITFTTFAAGGHFTTEILALPAALDFAKAAFDTPIAGGCSANTVLDEALNPIALGANLEPILTKLAAILLRLGRRDSRVKADVSVLHESIV